MKKIKINEFLKGTFGILFVACIVLAILRANFESESSKICSELIKNALGAGIIDIEPILLIGFLGIIIGAAVVIKAIVPLTKEKFGLLFYVIILVFSIFFFYFFAQTIIFCPTFSVEFVIFLAGLVIFSVILSWILFFLKNLIKR